MARGRSTSPSSSTRELRDNVHTPNRFEATREKDPHRVEGGRKAARTRGQQVHDDLYDLVDEESIPEVDRHGRDVVGADFHPGKNPTRSQTSKRVAQERGHDAFVEMGKKGGRSQKGIHTGQINGLDADDYSTYLEHPEVGLPEKNPNRVLGGKKAATTRGLHVHDDDHDENEMEDYSSNRNTSRSRSASSLSRLHDSDNSGKNPNRVEGGKKAARARGQHVHDDSLDDQSDSGISQHDRDHSGKNPHRVDGGKKAARTRGLHVHDDDESEAGDYHGKNPNRVAGGKKAASHFDHQHFVELGQKGGRANASKHGHHSHEEEDEGEMSSSSSSHAQYDRDHQGKNPNRVEGGKKAARSRGQHVHDDDLEQSDIGSSRPSSSRSHHDSDYSGKNPNRVEGGKKAARARGQHVHDDDLDDQSDVGDYHGKNPHRVAGGKKAASHFDHQHFVELGQKGGRANAAKHGYHGHEHDMEGEHEESSTSSSSRSHDNSAKNPNRVRGGKQAALTRGDHVDDTDDYLSSSSSGRRQSSSSTSRGRDTSLVMRKRVDDEPSDEDYTDDRASRESVYTHAGFPLSTAGVRDDGKSGARVRGGQSAALQRGLHVERGEEEMASGNPNRVRGGLQAASHRSHEDFVEMGKKGGRAHDSGATYDHLTAEGKNPNRVRGGYKAARARGDQTHELEHELDADLDQYGDSAHRSHHDSDYLGKNPNRVEGGKKAASHFDHQHFSEMGKKGAAARHGKESLHDDNEKEYEGEQSSKSQGAYKRQHELLADNSPSKRLRTQQHYAY